MKILAHRGAAAKNVAQNTIEAFRLAVAQLADGIETDVRLSADGLPVILHDRVVGADRQLVSLVTHRELETIVSHDVPLLDDIFSTIGPTFWNIEIKSRDAVAACCEILASRSHDELLVTSFDHRIVEEVASKTSVRCGLLTGHWVDDVPRFLANFGRWPHVDTVVWNYDFLDANQVLVAKNLGFRNFAWNALTPDDVAACGQMELDGIIVDDVPMARQITWP
jgi:glycerophosphoryl diester phosphodiesterase